MKVSVIIPTYNEELRIGLLIDHLNEFKGDLEVEILVSDGESIDHTLKVAQEKNAIAISSNKRGRAFQMNAAADIATGDIFYFVHADTFPPKGYTNCIKEAVLNGYTSGCCAYEFDSAKWPLKINSYLTQFNSFLTGGGDQTLFVTAAVFKKLKGFDTNYPIMEDFDLTRRLKRNYNFKILQNKALVSARKYEKNNYIKVNFTNILAMIMFWIKIEPVKIQHMYKTIIKN